MTIRNIRVVLLWTTFVLVFSGTLFVQHVAAQERYAFLVGIRQYNETELNPLRYTENDIRDLASTLIESGYNPKNVVEMTQTMAADNARRFPSQKNIQNELDLMLSELKAADSIVVGLSGHGIQYAGESTNYFCPIDGSIADKRSLISLEEISAKLKACRAQNKVLILDACRNDPTAKLGRAAGTIELAPVITRPKLEGGLVAFYSCSNSQQSFEHPDLEHGLFFYYLVHGLRGPADFDHSGTVSITELELYTNRKVQAYARDRMGVQQTPEVIGTVRGEMTIVELPVKGIGGDRIAVEKLPVPDLPTLNFPCTPQEAERLQTEWAEAYGFPGRSTFNSIGMQMMMIPPGKCEIGMNSSHPMNFGYYSLCSDFGAICRT